MVREEATMNPTAAVDSASLGPVMMMRTLILEAAGPAAQRPVIGTLAWVDLGSVAAILVLALIASTALAAIGRRRARLSALATPGIARRHLAAFAFGTPAQVF